MAMLRADAVRIALSTPHHAPPGRGGEEGSSYSLNTENGSDRGAIELFDRFADRVAERVAEIVRAAPKRGALVDAKTVAAALGVSRDCVYAHAAELGGQRIGNGPRGRLRFDLDRVVEVWTARSQSKKSHEAKSCAPASLSTSSRRRPTGSSSGLLPIRGTERPQEADLEGS
jgi:hypothetical protein